MNRVANERKHIPYQIAWTTEELQRWVKADLIPLDLLEQHMHTQLADYIHSNKEKLYAHFRQDPEFFDAQVALPPQSEWEKTYELQLIDKRTGKVIKTLEKVAEVQLCDDVYLKIRARELDEWQQEIKAANSLTKEQRESLKEFVGQYGRQQLTRSEIATFIKITEEKEDQETKVSTIRPSCRAKARFGPAKPEKKEQRTK